MKKTNIIMALVGIALTALLFVQACALEQNEPVRPIPIVHPYVSVPPQSASYNLSGEYTIVPLSIEIYDWDRRDGTLSYQWYAFTDIDDYFENGATPVTGANGPSYLPVITAPQKGESYFYYVKVTNDFPDAMEDTPTTWSVESAVAIISFYDNTMAPIPIINRNPIDATYTVGRVGMVNALDVNASVIGNGTLNYQWYSNTVRSITGGTEITGANDSSYLPDVTSLKSGKYYFYVKIDNTFNAGTERNPRYVYSEIFSVPAEISMERAEKVATPKITIQPRDQFIITTELALNLLVEAVSNDGGDISYQWYEADKDAYELNYTVIGEPIVDADDDSGEFLPPISTSAAGVAYYYVVATNTNLEVKEGNPTTATEQSKVVTVRVGVAGSKSENATITFGNTSLAANRYQYIRGYGGMDVAWANFPNTTEANTETMYNPDWGLGFNILRIMIVPPGTAQRNYTNHSDLILGRDPDREDYNGWSGLVPKHRPDYIKNVKVVNKYNGYVLASPWTPPKEWKTNNSINSGGHLIPSNYKNFAYYLRSFCQFMYLQGAPVYAVSIANEPNYAGGYDGCEWTPAQMRDFFVQVGQFTQGVRGWGGGKSTSRVLIVNGESANNPDINFAVLNDTTARNSVDFFARHVYGDQTKTLWSNQYASWEEGSPFQTECWMTEHNINSANALAFFNDSTWDYIWRFMNDVDLVIRLNKENAFVWWASKRFYSYIGDGQSGTTDGAKLPRGYGLSHYAKYSNETTRIKFEMTGNFPGAGGPIGPLDTAEDKGGKVNTATFSLDSLDPKIVAFESPDKSEISLVMFTPTSTSGSGGVNMGTIKIVLPDGFLIGSVKAVKSWRTKDGQGNDETHLMKPYEVTVNSDRKTAWVELNSSEILSVRFTRQ